MKRLSYFALLSAFLCLAGVSNVLALDYSAVVTNVSVSQLNSITKNQFTVTITQDGWNSSSGSPYRNSTAKLILESDDRSLEGTYKSTNASNSNKIGEDSEATYGKNTGRMLRSDKESKITINKTASGYEISSSNGWLGFEKSTSTYNYTYCFYYTNVAQTEYALGNFAFSYTPESYCDAPTGLTRSDLTFSWTSSASSFQYCCLPSNITLTDAVWIANRQYTSSKSVTLEGLARGGTYKFYVLAEGPSGTSKIVSSSAFTITCGTIAHTELPWNEGFEEMAASVKPYCWTEHKNNSATVRTYSSQTKTGSRVMRLYGGSTSSEVIAVFPDFEDNINALGLSFWYKSSVSNTDNKYGNIQLGYITDPADATTFEAVGDPLKQTSDYVQVLDYVMSEAPNGAYFAVKYSGGDAYIDDITIDVKPSSVCPTSMTISNITSNAATVSWNANGMSAWRLQYSEDGETWSDAVAVNTNSYTLTSLNAQTSYFVRVKGYNGGESAASIVRTFTTLCPSIATLPWMHNFDDDESNTIPDCWAKIGYNSAYYGKMPSVNANASYAHGGSGKYLFSYGGGSSSTTIIILPPFEEETANLAVSFWYNNRYTDAVYGRTELGYITDPNDASTFQYLQRFDKVSEYTFVDHFPMTGAPAGSRIAIRHQGGSSDYGYSDVDDISVDLIPQCNAPIDINISNITNSGATISWTALNGETAWKLQYSEDGENWNEAIDVNSKPYTLTGLSKTNTLYYVRVKAVCGGASGESVWSNIVSFRTDCDAVSIDATTYWKEDFESMAEHIVPECWNNSASTTTSSWGAGYIWGTYNHTSNTMLAMNNSALDGGTALINSPSFDIPDDGREYELTFDYSNMAIVGNNLSVKISANGGAFVEKGVYYPSGNVSSYPGAFSNAVISLADYSGQTIKVQFFANPTSGTSSEGGAMFVDNVSVHKVSNCIVPTALAAGNLTANSAQITWTAGGSETAWRLQYRADGGDWSAEQAVSGSAQRNLTGLSANTEYFVRVKAYCDAEDQSNWSDVLSFTTLCAAAPMPFSEEFSSASELPSCWEATSTSSYGWSAYEKTGAYSVQLRTGSSGEATLRMPSISLSEDAILQFEWKNVSGAQVNLYISTDGGTTKTMIPNDLSGVHADWTTKIFDLSAYTSETALIYFVANFSTANQYAYLDDVEVIARPCEMILNIQAAPITGGATISWSGEVKKLQYKTGSDGWSSVTIPSGDYAGPKTITNLTPARTYQVRLLPACSEEAEGNWTTPIFFTTTSTESVPYFNDFELETPGYVPFNWSRISSTDYPQVVYDSYAYGEFGEKGNSVKFYGVNEQILVLPEFNASLRDLKISFHYRNRDCTMELGYVKDDGTTFVAIETLPNQTGYAEFPYEKDLYNISSDASKLAIRYSNAGSQAQAWVDNVSIDFASCGQPRNLTFSDLTSNSVHISWTASERGTESNYQYINKIWSESDPNWSSATLIESNVHELNLTNLTPNKDYEFYLRSYCGASDQSTPIKIEFKTLVTEEVFEDSPSANNNEARLAALHNQTVSITFNRPLPRNGDYSTICLPFDLTATQIADPDCPLHGFVIKEFDHSGNGEARVNLYLKQVTSIEAGKPYFVRYAGAPTDVALTPLRFLNVKVTASTPAAGEGDECIAQGIFNPHSLVANDQNTLFLSSNNTLYYPTANGTMNGFRVYISVADGSPMHNAIRNGLPISVCEQESTTTTIDSVTQTESTGKGTKIIRNGQLYIIYKGTMYNVQGKRIH